MYTLTASPSVVSIGSSAALDPEKYKLRLEKLRAMSSDADLLAVELTKRTAIAAAKQQALTRRRPSSGLYPPTRPVLPPEPPMGRRIPIRRALPAKAGKNLPSIAAASAAKPATPPALMKQLTVEEQFQRKKAVNDIMSMAESGLNSRFSDMYKAFQYVDLDRSGRLSKEELRRALDLWNIPLTDEKLNLIMDECDLDGDGVSYTEFVDKLARETVAPSAMGKRGMQSAEAMGVDAFELMDQQLGHGGIKKHNVSINAK